MMSLEIPPVSLDTIGIPLEQHIGYQEVLTLSPKLKESETRSLSYKWEISEEIETNRTTAMKVIGDKLDLEYKVERPIATAPYRLRLTITDKDNADLQTIYSWPVYVRSAFITGLVVAHTKDGVTSNISYAKNKNISRNYDKDQVTMHDILGENGKINDLIKSLWYSSLGRQWHKHTGQLWVTTEKGRALRYDTKDFSINGDSEKTDLILYKPDGLKFISFFGGGESLFAHTTDGFYSLLSESINTFSTPDIMMKGQKFSNDIVAGDWRHNPYSINKLIWFDQENGKFASRIKHQSAYSLGKYSKADNIFDPNDLKGNEALAGEIAADYKTVSFLLKNTSTGEYAIYEMAQYNKESNEFISGIAQGKYTIPNTFKTIMDQAKSFVFSKRSKILYVASNDKLYTVTYGIGTEANPNTKPIYTLPSDEELSSARLFIQGEFRARSEEVEYRLVPGLSYNLNAIMIASQKGEYDGVVRIIKFSGEGESLDMSEENTFNGFGKILDLISIGM